MDLMIKEAVEIKLHPNNFNRDTGFILGWSWYLVMNMLKQYRDALIQEQGHAKEALDSAR
jgi:hypothetical protein